MFTWCNHRTEQMDVLRTMNFQANGTDNTIHKKYIIAVLAHALRSATKTKKNIFEKKAMNNNNNMSNGGGGSRKKIA